MPNSKMIIGILGAPCSGKTTIAAQFARLACAVIDADKIAHELLETAKVKKKVQNEFGKGVFNAQGQIDRQKLSEQVFKNNDNVDKINKIIHPLVLTRCENLIADYNDQTKIKAIVLDIPLLAEVGWQKKCDKLIFVDCNDHIRTQRMAQKEGFYKKEQKKREKFQISLDKKQKIADYTISNNSDMPAAAEQVARLFTSIINNC